MKLNCLHADTCLPDYWRGHHLPHVMVPVWNGRSFADIRKEIKSELAQGAVMGNCEDARLLSGDCVHPHEAKRADALTKAAYAAVNRDVRGAKKGQRTLKDKNLPTLADMQDCEETVYAYFVFVKSE